MKVVELVVENYKRIKAARIKAAEGVNIVSGANGQGKTSVLDAIWAALGGGAMAKSSGTVEPIRKGETKASVSLDLGDMLVTRSWTEKGSYVNVESKDGARYKSPQAILDGLVGKIALDPLAFANASPASQRESLLALVGIGDSLDEIEKKRAAMYNERTEVNREAKRLFAQRDTLPPVPTDIGDIPDDVVSMVSVLDEQRKARDVLESNDRRRRLLVDTTNSVRSLSQEVEDTDAQIQELLRRKEDIVRKLKSVEEQRNELVKQVDELVDPDMDVFVSMITNIERTNEAVRLREKHEDVRGKLLRVESKSKELTKGMMKLDMEKEGLLSRAALPVDGLGFEATGVTYNGIPLSQCSSAEQLRVSVAVAMASAPKLRVIRITDGSLLDSNSMAVIEQMAKEHDYQCWIEKVDESGKIGIYIEDGEVVSQAE